MYQYCMICGVSIRPNLEGPGIALPTKDLEWDQIIRAVRRVDGDSTASLTGVGYLNSMPEITAPQNPSDTYQSTSASLGLYRPLYDPDTGAWTFLFHAACWDILLARLSANAPNTSILATTLHNLLYCTTWNRHRLLRPGHDFGGASNFQNRVQLQWQEMTDRGFAHLTADPSRFLSVDDLFRYLEGIDANTKKPTLGLVPSSRSTSDVFRKLPIEVVHLLLTWLPSNDVQQLRLVSKPVAYASHPRTLSQFFWRSRFLSDFEMGFALPVNTDGFQDWRTLYFAIRRSLESRQGSKRLRNRKRVWDIVSKNASLFASHLSGVELGGEVLPRVEYSVSGRQNYSTRPRQGKVIATQSTTRDTRLLHVGSRKLSDRRIRLRFGGSNLLTITVATVAFNSQTFISGFRFLIQDSATGTHSGYCLGYVPSGVEATLSVGPDQGFVGFELATRANGIVGVRVILENNSRTYPSAWIGDIGQGDPDVAFGKLLMGKKTEDIDIVASFDAFKMIALAMTDNCNGSSGFNPQEFLPQDVWTPCYPRKTNLVPPTEIIEWQPFQPVLNIDFGGVGGDNLQRLTRLVAHMHDSNTAIVGLAFHFVGQERIHYGRQGLTEVSFFIDGPQGERISCVTYEQASASIGVWALQICTNFGNSVTFTPDQLRPERPGKSSPTMVSFPDGEAIYDKLEYAKMILDTPKGQTITGFTATLDISSGAFRNFGLQCEFVRDSEGKECCIREDFSRPPPSIRDLFSPLGTCLINEASSGCKAYTYAPLHNVRQIRFSCGANDRPRQEDEVSGMWLDYFGSRSPSIAGQWISEVDSLTLGKGENLTGFTIWISKLRYSTSQKYNLGRVVRVSINTSRKRSVTVPSGTPLPVDCNVLRFRDNRLERLSYVLWTFNNVWDHPRVLSRPNHSADRVFLWSPNGDHEMFPWIAPQKILWEGTSEEGNVDRVVSVSGHRSSTPDYQYTITGLKFAYQSGATRTIGCTHGEPTAEVSLESNNIAQMEWFTDRFGLFEIVFHCKGPGDSSSNAYALIGDPIESIERHGMAPIICCEWVDLVSRTHKASTIERPGLKEEYPSSDLPDAEAVGLWGFNMGEGDLTLGLVYLDMR